MKKYIIFSLLFSLSFHTHANPIIFDTDMAIDDWAALLYLLRHKNAEVIAVTISAPGEAHCDPAKENAASLLDLPKKIRRDIPIACGDDYPLDGYFVFPQAWRTDSDKLSGVIIAKSKRLPSSKHAADVIHESIVAAKEPVTIVATGPPTNIAQWLERYPEDKSALEQLVIMGGTVDAPGNIIVPLFTPGHPNKTAEWNIFIDPLAADKVFTANLPITLVGLDITNTVRVTKKIAEDFKETTTTPPAIFWGLVLEKNDWFIDSGEYYFWDTLAAMIAVEPELCEGDTQQLKVTYQTTTTPWQQTTDNNMPDKRWDGKPRNHLNAATAGTLVKDETAPAIKVCRKTQPEKIFRKFKDVLNR